MEIIEQLIGDGDYQAAGERFIEVMEQQGLNEQLAIYGATIAMHMDQSELAYQYIESGLKLNPDNYELYVCLGDYYFSQNVNLAFLAYEQAYYLCSKQGDKDEDAVVIKEMMESAKNTPGCSVKPASFVILSWNTLELTKACIRSIQNSCYEGAYELVLIDNGSTDGSAEYLQEISDTCIVKINKENRGFGGGCNQGISLATEGNDIFLLNSDTEMMPHALFLMRLGLYANDRIGAVGATSNYVANYQRVKEEVRSLDEGYKLARKINVVNAHAMEQKDYLVGFATLIRRSVVDEIGGLDEQFKLGNFEDNDFGVRILKSGHQNVLLHNVFIFHWGSESFLSNKVDYSLTMQENAEIFREKWGISPTYYGLMRTELMDFFPEDKSLPLDILELGCGSGGTICHLDYLYPNATVHGLELSAEAVAMGSVKCDIRVCNLETDEIPYPKHSMDFIILADVLEHLRDSDESLQKFKEYLKPGGKFVVSLPNIMNAKVIYELLQGVFRYADAGILDRTHLKFFTLQQIYELVARNGLKIDDIKTMVFEPESTHAPELEEFFDQLMKVQPVAQRELFDVYQFIFCASTVE